MIKGDKSFLTGLSLVTVLFLLYVHAQVALVQVSYDINTKSQKLTQQNEEYRRLKFEVDQLKAPRLLEERMRELELDLTLPKEVRVVRMPKIQAQQPAAPVNKISLQPFSDSLMDLLGRWVKVAQAKTDN